MGARLCVVLAHPTRPRAGPRSTSALVVAHAGGEDEGHHHARSPGRSSPSRHPRPCSPFDPHAVSCLIVAIPGLPIVATSKPRGFGRTRRGEETVMNRQLMGQRLVLGAVAVALAVPGLQAAAV